MGLLFSSWNTIKQVIDKIRGWHSHRLVKWAQISCLISLIPSLVMLYYLYNPVWGLLTIVGILIISKVGHSIGQHRYFCHRSFKTGPLREWLLGFFSTLCLTYSAPHYAAVHRHHHRTSDSPGDPHCPDRIGSVRAFLGFLDKKNVENISPRIIGDLVGNRVVRFFHDWYWPTIICWLILLSIINPLLIIWCWVIPVGYTQFVNGTQTLFGHRWGYRNFNLPDKSTNNTMWNILTLGEGLHNNHHEKPAAPDFAFTENKWEWDFAGWVIRVFFITKTPNFSN
jgi:stearoyl-CoA desaturase (delta-9 desaturase)